LWEIPAGLLDVGGEAPLAAAQRELAEEADLEAKTWHVLVDLLTSPGGSDEALRIYLARDLTTTSVKFARKDEEAAMQVQWIPLDDVITAILAGRVQNPSAVVGALAAFACRASGWAGLRPADAAWSHRPTPPQAAG
jgi:ADP-ribose pyrophosphatase